MDRTKRDVPASVVGQGVCPLLAMALLFGVVWTRAVASEIPPCITAPASDSATLAKLARSRQPDRGIMWTVSKGGRLSYLYATVHVAKLAWDFPGPVVKAALLKSNRLTVEMDLTDQAVLAGMAQESQAAAGRASAEQISESRSQELRSRVQALARSACIDEQTLGNATLGSEITALSLLSARATGLFPNFAIDSALVGFARATGKAVDSLETPAEQVAALQSGGFASAERAVVQLENGEAAGVIVELARAWATGDLADLERFPSWCKCTAGDLSALLDRRNAVLADRLDRAFSTQDGTFAAIGALHMIGESGMISRLRRAGYTVELVVPVESSIRH